jgi:hypothetical protein
MIQALMIQAIMNQAYDSGSPREVGMNIKNIKKSLIKSIFCLTLMFFVGVAAIGDTIRLKDGSILKGKVVSYAQGKFTIIVYIGGGSSKHVISVEEIDSVEFDASDLAASARDANQGGGLVPVTQEAAPGDRPLSTPAGEATGSPRTARETGETAPPASAANDLPPAEAPGANSLLAEKALDVAAAADWTSTGIRVQKGQRIIIEASGEVELGNNRRSGPDGLSLSDSRKLIPNRPTGALIAVVGDDNDDFVYVGAAGEFVSTHNGILFLSVNEGNLKDNNGAFAARIKVMSGK